jgi:hypothetical protein
MKKTLLIAGALLALTASVSFAGGVNLSWNNCGAAGAASRTSACTNNAQAGSLFISATPPVDMNSANGQTSTVDIQTTAAALSPWWNMNGVTGCVGRTTAWSCNMDFTGGPAECNDPWAGQASPGANYVSAFEGVPNRARGKGTGAIPGITPITADTEWGICKLNIGGARTIGTGSCAGCLDGACFVLNDVFLTQPIGLGDYHISNPIDRQHVSWQASGASIAGGCPGATPARQATWGSVKSLYR